MIDVEAFPILANNMSTLKETSVDNHDGNICYMTESLISAINFDAVKEAYVKPLGISESPKSNDALVILSNDSAVFIEFKNGKMHDKKIFDVRKKIFDSMLIFTDLVGVGITQTRSKMEYVLVYNESVNSAEDATENSAQPSRHRDAISSIILRQANMEYVKFGLEAFEKYCFKKVHTYTKAEFDQYFLQPIS